MDELRIPETVKERHHRALKQRRKAMLRVEGDRSGDGLERREETKIVDTL